MEIKNKQLLEIALERLIGEEDIFIFANFYEPTYDYILTGPLYRVDVEEDGLLLHADENNYRNSLSCSQLLFILQQYHNETKLKLVMNEKYEVPLFYLDDKMIDFEAPHIVLYGGRNQDGKVMEITDF